MALFPGIKITSESHRDHGSHIRAILSTVVSGRKAIVGLRQPVTIAIHILET